jgi:Phosphotransferase enzyme family.
MDFENFTELLRKFKLDSEPVAVKECKNGNINKTFIVETVSGRRYILQRVNENVFKKPDEVMENILHVTEFLRTKISQRGGDPAREALNLVQTKNGGYSVRGGDDGYWRVYDVIVDAVSHEKIEREGQFWNAGYAFGDFQRMLDEFPADKLHETIKNFHNTPARYSDFKAALDADRAGRAASVADEIAFIEEHKWLCPFIMDGIESGAFPLRVTHNDTKLNNIMMDVTTDAAVCVIDLDTVMPGSVLFDYGDAIRYGASNAGEDEKDLSQVYIKLDLFEEFTRGFIEGLGGTLNEAEINALPTSVAVIALELAMRFLGDYLNGDTYFTVRYPGHNLDRARTQLKLVEDVLNKRESMESIVHDALVRS